MKRYYIETPDNTYEEDAQNEAELRQRHKDVFITKIAPVKGHHLCKYCYGIAEGEYEDLLCPNCREVFGHSLYSEL